MSVRYASPVLGGTLGQRATIAAAIAISIAAEIAYIQRQPKCSVTRPPPMRPNRIPRKSPESTVPTARPRSPGGASSDTSGTTSCERLAPMPAKRPAATSSGSDGAAPIAIIARIRQPSFARIRRRLSSASPSGERKSVPDRNPANDSVGTQPTSAALAPKSRASSGSIGVWKWIVPAVANMNTVSRTIRPRLLRGPGSFTLPPLARGHSLPPPRPAARHRARLVDPQRAAVQLLAVQAGDRRERMLLPGHFDEAESLRRAGKELALHLGRFHLAERLEQRDELVLGRLRCQVAYEDVHLGSSFVCMWKGC